MTSAFDLVVFQRVPRSLSVLSSSDSVSLYRGPRSFLEFSPTSALSGFLRRPRLGLSVLRCSDSVLLTEVRGLWYFFSWSLGPSRSEVRGPLGCLYDVGAFALSPTSALLVSVLFPSGLRQS